jgi:hypothetical protein
MRDFLSRYQKACMPRLSASAKLGAALSEYMRHISKLITAEQIDISSQT